MKREDILKDYEVSAAGTIMSPGKFEGEPIYAPYFYDALLNGFADNEDVDEDGGVADCEFRVTDEDRAEFPELGDAKIVILSVCSNGFVYTRVK